MAPAKREWFKAAEVCEVAEVQPYMLRSWEAEFPQLGRTPSGGGPRLYRRTDIEMVLRIKSLVFGEGLTLAGARRRLEEMADTSEPPVMLREKMLGDEVRSRLRVVRDGLRDLLQMLSADNERDLVLTPAPAKRPAKSKRRAS